jgi:hypothetical protein
MESTYYSGCNKLEDLTGFIAVYSTYCSRWSPRITVDAISLKTLQDLLQFIPLVAVDGVHVLQWMQ